MSISRFEALDATSVVTPAVIRLVPGLAGCMAPKVNCVIFESDPVGVVEVSAVAFAAISVSTMMSGMESAPSHGSTPNHSWFSQMMMALNTGMPMKLTLSGSSMPFRQSPPSAPRRANGAAKAEISTFGLAKSPSIEAVSIIDTPHHRHQVLVRWARPKTAAAMS